MGGYDFLSVSGPIGIMRHAACEDMLQSIVTYQAFQFIPDASRVKLQFLA
jgi:hypothetical protein